MSINNRFYKFQTNVQNYWSEFTNGPSPSTQTELLDEPGHSPEELERCFKDLKLINRYFGGVGPVYRAILNYLPPPAVNPVINLLDIASGAADVPLAVTKILTRRGYTVNLTLVDLNPTHVSIAGGAAVYQQCNGGGPATLKTLATGFDDPEIMHLAPFDFVTCSLAFHHFTVNMRINALQMMAKLSTRAFIVNDLERSWFGYLGALVLGRTLTRNRLVRHDAPLSVLRGFNTYELELLGCSANFPDEVDWNVERAPFSRLLLIGSKR